MVEDRVRLVGARQRRQLVRKEVEFAHCGARLRGLVPVAALAAATVGAIADQETARADSTASAESARLRVVLEWPVSPRIVAGAGSIYAGPHQ